MDLVPFYLRRKIELDDIKRRHNSSFLKKKTLEILSNEAIEMTIDSIERAYHNQGDEYFDNSSFEERFARYLEEFKNEKNK